MNRLILITVLVFSLLQLALAQDAKFDAAVEKQIQAVVNEHDPIRTHEKYRELFKAAGPGGLAGLKLHSHDSIAIQAAWEEVALTVPETEGAQAVRLDRNKLDWFLGFIEGRGRIKAPTWWVDVLRDARANRRNNIYPGSPKTPLYHKAGLDEVLAPLDTTLSREDGKIILKIAKDSVFLPEVMMKKWSSGKVSDRVSALFTHQRCYVAVHNDWGYPFQLSCIDRASGKIEWNAKVHGVWWWAAAGESEMWVTVTEHQDRIFVFGAASLGLHVEAFRSDTGANLFRFSSSY